VRLCIKELYYCLSYIQMYFLGSNAKILLSIRRLKSYQDYQILRINLRLSSYGPDAVVFFGMAGGGLLIVLSNFTTVKLYSTIPMPMFMCFPFFSFVCSVFGVVAIHGGAKCQEVSRKLLTTWKDPLSLSLFTSNRLDPLSSYWKRKYLSIKPACLKVGVNDIIFFELHRLTSSRFWYETLYYSLTAIIFLPGRHK